MPRNMSFALTTSQIRDRSKTVTRRFGWWFLVPGDQVWAVEVSDNGNSAAYFDFDRSSLAEK